MGDKGLVNFDPAAPKQSLCPLIWTADTYSKTFMLFIGLDNNVVGLSRETSSNIPSQGTVSTCAASALPPPPPLSPDRYCSFTCGQHGWKIRKVDVAHCFRSLNPLCLQQRETPKRSSPFPRCSDSAQVSGCTSTSDQSLGPSNRSPARGVAWRANRVVRAGGI